MRNCYGVWFFGGTKVVPVVDIFVGIGLSRSMDAWFAAATAAASAVGAVLCAHIDGVGAMVGVAVGEEVVLKAAVAEAEIRFSTLSPKFMKINRPIKITATTPAKIFHMMPLQKIVFAIRACRKTYCAGCFLTCGTRRTLVRVRSSAKNQPARYGFKTGSK
jgi:hypothetical protein